jgi:hypothetical protein
MPFVFGTANSGDNSNQDINLMRAGGVMGDDSRCQTNFEITAHLANFNILDQIKPNTIALAQLGQNPNNFP